MSDVYVVRRRTRDEVCFDDIPEPQWQYWAARETREEAEALARELDLGEWLVNGPPSWVNPFSNGLDAVTTMPEGVFRDWLMDEGIEPPAPLSATNLPAALSEAEKNRFLWMGWWESVRPPEGKLTRVQMNRIREGLNRVALWSYEVVEVETAEALAVKQLTTVYAIVLQSWEYDDSWYCGGNVALGVYRNKGRAQAECDRLNKEEPTECSNGGPNVHVVVELQVAADAGT